MRYVCEDKRFYFKYAFDTVSGAYVRTGILDENGVDTSVCPNFNCCCTTRMMAFVVLMN